MRVVGLLCLSFLLSHALAAQELPPIIDMHLHVYPVGVLGPPGVPNPATGRPSPETDEALRRENVAALDRFNIVRAVTSGCPFELVREWKRADPGRIIAAPYIGGSRDCRPSIESLRDAHEAGELEALGELGLQYQGLTLASEEVEPYLALAEELELPVAVHVGPSPPGATYDCCPRFRVALANPLLIEEALVRHPGARVYLMHAGYPFIDETIALLHAHPQVYADLAVINWVVPREEFHDYLRSLVRAGFSDRLMFGSDQMMWPEAIEMAIEGIESAEFLSEGQKRDIFYNNAARFLRLTEEQIASDHGR